MTDRASDRCRVCGAPVFEMDVRCGACGVGLTSTGAQRRIGSVLLEHYEVTDVLGQGGMSLVYRGRHRLTGQEVALKILPPELAVHDSIKSRFLEEARALAQLDHPNIVHLYGFGQDADCFVLAMQLVSGATWERLIIDRGRLDWRLTARIAIDVLRALEYAHSRGVIHRDMKPSNVLVREDGSAMVMDFGIAKMTTSSRLTATGQTMGTVRYMSPEQVRAGELDLRTDLYSLAVTMYESLAGETPFDGGSHFEIMTAHLSTPPPAVTLEAPDTPRALSALVATAMAKSPSARPASAASFRLELEAILAADPPAAGGGPRPAASARRAPRSARLAVVISGSVAVAGGATIALRGRRDAREAAPAAGAASAPRSPASTTAAWPDPFVLPDLELAVDHRYDAALVRVLSVAPRDAGRVRDLYVAAQARFFAVLQAADVAGVARQPLNVVIVPPTVLCDRRIDEKGVQPSGCADSGMFLRFRDRTAYLADLPDRLATNLADAAAQNVCLHAPTSAATACDAALETYYAELATPPAK